MLHWMCYMVRRTLHQVWYDTGKKVSSHTVVWKDDSLWMREAGYIVGMPLYRRITNLQGGMWDNTFPDVDTLAEQFYEATEKETATIEVLYGNR